MICTSSLRVIRRIPSLFLLATLYVASEPLTAFNRVLREAEVGAAVTKSR